MDVHVIILLIWESLCLLIQLVVFTALVRQHYQHRKTKILLFFRIITTICSISYLLFGVFDLCHVMVAFQENRDIIDYNHTTLVLIIRIADVFYFIASLSTYTLFFGRVYHTFKLTQWRVSRKLICFMCILYLYSIACMIMFLYSINISFDAELIWFVSLMISELCICVSLTILFIYKLNQLALQRSSYYVQEQHMNDMMDDQNTDLDLNTHRIIYVITRYSILSIIAISFGMLWYFISLYQLFFMDHANNLSFTISYFCRALEITICGIVLYLSVGFNKRQYDTICSCCHQACSECFIKNIKKTIKDSVYYGFLFFQ
eukprot:218731_1